MIDETICALSTAPGRAGIAVVRMSGPESFGLLSKILAPGNPLDRIPARSAVLSRIVDPRTGDELDQVLVTRFPEPHSYTGEDLVEISLHGSPVLVALLLEILCAHGARLAEPGEFTMRAFLRGRLDLTQAEAVRDVIEAKTLYQAQVAGRQREGEISRQLQPIKRMLIDLIVDLESAVEFVEENLPLQSRADLADRLDRVQRELGNWIDSFRRGRIVRDGFSMAVIGRPNVGKSSVFNRLLAQERSIVTEIPGTTRDLVSEFMQFDGIPVRLVDTAGLRTSEDRVEQIGVERSLRVASEVDAILLVVDTSQARSSEDESLKQKLVDFRCIVVMNKSDLVCVWPSSQKESYAGSWPFVEVSALTGAHLDVLRKLVLDHLFGDSGVSRDGILITNLRHCQCLEAAQNSLKRAAEALRAGLSEEFILVDLHAALQKLGAITGETSVEDLLGEIFSRFCVGK